MQQYVIIGNGVAAAGCIEGIRRVDQTGKISVISAENHPVYCRPLISYYLEGKTDLDKIGYRSPDFYDKMGCEVYYGKKAVKIDPQAKTVLLDDGTEKASVLLDKPDKGLIVEHNMWRDMIWNQANSVLCVAASEYYDPSDYIRSHDEFLRYINK